MPFNYTKAYSERGANMGRSNDNLSNFAGVKSHLERVHLDSGGYDKGGAYWGHDEPLFVLYADIDGGIKYFIRAKNRDAAKAAILSENDEVIFYR